MAFLAWSGSSLQAEIKLPVNTPEQNLTTKCTKRDRYPIISPAGRSHYYIEENISLRNFTPGAGG